MRFYPSYRLRDIFELYAVTFFALLNEGYRQENWNYLMLSQISDLPAMSDEDRTKFYRGLKWASTHPSDILKPSGKGSSPAEIKKALRG